MDSEYRALLEKQDWRRIHRDLVHFARTLAVSGKLWAGGTRRFSGGEEPMLADGCTPRDVVHQVISQTFEGQGQWKWDPERSADIRVHLKWRIRSKLSTLVEKDDNRKRIPVPKDEHGAERFDWLKAPRGMTKGLAEDGVGDHSEEDYSVDLLDRLSTQCLADHPGGDDFTAHLEKGLGDDPRLQDVLTHICNGTPPRRMADAMGISVREVNNLMKRLKRRSRQIMRPDVPIQGKANA
ncbi:MAG: hypothetical protein ABII00_09125 [Elusimicrobiota bacterium]